LNEGDRMAYSVSGNLKSAGGNEYWLKVEGETVIRLNENADEAIERLKSFVEGEFDESRARFVRRNK
jgi:hypothetical protein